MPDNAIRDYVQRGFSLVPLLAIPPLQGEQKWKKKPIVHWLNRKKKAVDVIEALAEFKKWPYALIGVVTGDVSGICTLDIDTDEGRKKADELVPDSLLAPTFTTMSGGLQMVFRNPNPSIPGKVRFLPGLDYRGEGSLAILPPSKNGNGGQYRWLDGLSLQEVEPPPMPASLYNILINYSSMYIGNEVKNEVTDFKRLQTTSNDFKMFIQGTRDNDLFHAANCLVKGGARPDEIYYILDILANNCTPPFPKNEIPSKIKSAMERMSRREINFAQEVRDFIVTSNGFFLTSDVFNRLQVTSRQEKKTIVLNLLRLQKEGTIERHGEKDGCYRRIESECDNIDFQNASTESVDFRWPFQIEQYVRTLPGNIIVVAGEPNGGKTAFLLNVILMNQGEHRINYFSSEMGAIELKDRLNKFNVPLKSWSFNAKERSSNFADVIKPDEINIIDFLEIHDEFYKIGGMIKEIYDKLSKGIAIIAIQKNRGNDYGLGGTRGLEKARLYLSMESGRLKIIKGKNWTGIENPNGLAINFKLLQGCKFIEESEWSRSEINIKKP